MSHPTDLRYAGTPYNRSEPMPEPGQPIRRGETITNIDPLGNVVPAPSEEPKYLVPPGLAKQAELAARAPEPALSDAIAEDAAPTAQYPPGAPRFRALTQLSFSDKAEAFELFDVVQEMIKVVGTPKKGEIVDGKRAAQYYRVLAQIDAFLRFVAVDQLAYDQWDGRHDDEKFGQTWAAYQAGAQPGEADSSSS